MRNLKNKHFIVAILVAPILAILAYLATDYHLKEKPQAAQPGQSYKLAAQSNCRYASGTCTLKNADIKIVVQGMREKGNRVNFQLASSHPLQRALFAIATPDVQQEPITMQNTHENKEHWHVSAEVDDPATSLIRLAVLINGARYFVETPAVFLDWETSFSRENFSQ